MGEPIEWDEAQSFEEYILHLIRTKQTKSGEFQTMIRIYGKEKLKEIYKKNHEKEKGDNDGKKTS